MKLIVAICKNGGIGYKNKIPWHLKKDLQHFKKMTIGNNNNAVIMGNNTWKSLNKTPLPKRTNIILTQKNIKNISENTIENSSCIFKNSIDGAIQYCEKNRFDDIWIIGGTKIYDLAFKKNIVNEIYLTDIKNDFTCDTYFNDIPPEFKLFHQTNFIKENDITFNFKFLKKA
jgi:dihydrofolate reductase